MNQVPWLLKKTLNKQKYSRKAVLRNPPQPCSYHGQLSCCERFQISRRQFLHSVKSEAPFYRFNWNNFFSVRSRKKRNGRTTLPQDRASNVHGKSGKRSTKSSTKGGTSYFWAIIRCFHKITTSFRQNVPSPQGSTVKWGKTHIFSFEGHRNLSSKPVKNHNRRAVKRICTKSIPHPLQDGATGVPLQLLVRCPTTE